MTRSVSPPASLNWADLTAPELNSLAARRATVLVPVGSTEQHGPHLGTGTDSVLVAEVCRRAASQMSDAGIACVITPTVWTGLAAHHTSFGGTFTLSLATFAALLEDICNSIHGAGFHDVILVNGHGGNMAALTAIATDISVRSGKTVQTTTYFIEAAAEIGVLLEDQAAPQHACEAETSMIWATAPQSLRRKSIVDGPDFDLDASLRPSLRGFQPFSALTANGVSGKASRASAKKGEALLTAASTVLADRLMDRVTVLVSNLKESFMAAPLSPYRSYMDLIFLSGHVPVIPGTADVPQAFEDQARIALKNLCSSLRTAGSAPEKLLSMTVFVASREDIPAFNLLFKAIFAEPYPARAVLVADLPDARYRVEIQAIAHR